MFVWNWYVALRSLQGMHSLYLLLAGWYLGAFWMFHVQVEHEYKCSLHLCFAFWAAIGSKLHLYIFNSAVSARGVWDAKCQDMVKSTEEVTSWVVCLSGWQHEVSLIWMLLLDILLSAFWFDPGFLQCQKQCLHGTAALFRFIKFSVLYAEKLLSICTPYLFFTASVRG